MMWRVVCLASIGMIVGCSSELIEHPGLSGRFVWQDTKEPIAGVVVQYSHIAHERTVEVRTDANGRFAVEPTFTRGYTGFPTSPVGLQVRWQLRLGEKHNPSGSGLFVNNTDVARAVIEMGTIEIPPVFRSN